MKKCSKCEQEKEWNQFYKVDGKPMARCMECVRRQYSARYHDIVKPRTIAIRNEIRGVSAHGKS